MRDEISATEGASSCIDASGGETLGSQNFKNSADFKNSVNFASEIALLSPACASLDQFKSYAERGELFKKQVAQLG